MADSLIHVVSGSPLLLLFLVIGLGSLLGGIRVAGFSLGPAAVLFTGILCGILDPSLDIPEQVYLFGLVLFVYTIGLQSGPIFFSSFGRRSIRANLMVVSVLLISALLTVFFRKMLGLDGPTSAGIFCGALTNTPALATAVEAVRGFAGSAGGDEASRVAVSNAPVIGYSVAYPFGVIGVLAIFYAYGKIRRKEPAGVVSGEAGEQKGQIMARTFRVVNPGVIGKSVKDLFALQGSPGFVLSRLRRGEVTSLVYSETALALGDLVVAVGDSASLERAHLLFGEESPRQIHTENEEFEYRRVEVSDRDVVGKTLRELNLQEMMDATVTRVRRGDVDFVPTGDTVVERGDRVRVITWSGNMDRVVRFFGDSVKASAEADFLSFSLGIVMGVLLGLVRFPLPGGSDFSLGIAGGPLIVGLVLGRVQRTGPLGWGLPFSVNITLRQIGLMLFLAGIGTRAGDAFLPTIAAGGWKILVAGAAVTGVATFLVMFLGMKVLRLSMIAAMGLVSGFQTQPACLAYATDRTSSNAPNVWYASVYPAAMIGKIVLAQALVSHFL